MHFPVLTDLDISIKLSLKIASNGPINNMSALAKLPLSFIP